MWGAWVAQMVKHLPSAQVMIPGSWDQALCPAPCSAGSLLLLLPLPPLLFFFSFSLPLKSINKTFKKIKKKEKYPYESRQQEQNDDWPSPLLCTLGQGSSNSEEHINHLGISLKCRVGFSRTGMRPKILHF